MKDDLNKLEQQWAKRRLFSPARRRRRWPWLVLLLLIIALTQFLLFSSPIP